MKYESWKNGWNKVVDIMMNVPWVGHVARRMADRWQKKKCSNSTQENEKGRKEGSKEDGWMKKLSKNETMVSNGKWPKCNDQKTWFLKHWWVIHAILNVFVWLKYQFPSNVKSDAIVRCF